MEILLYIAAFCMVAISAVHSVLGEKYILIRLFRRDNLPELFGSTDFTVRTLRCAWHLTTVTWLAFAVLLILMAHPPVSTRTLGIVIAATFFLHFIIALIGTRGRHLSWILFLVVAICAYAASPA